MGMISGRVLFLVDGFNLYHSIDEDKRLHRYKWLDLSRLCRILIPKRCEVSKIYYCTTYATWNPSKYARHQTYVRALKTARVDVIFGKFKQKDITCRLCNKMFRAPIEKQTDINIAMQLLQEAFRDTYDSALIISGDTDLIPAIVGVKQTFPTKQVGVAFPIGRSSRELKQVADFTMKLSEHHMSTSQFPLSIPLDGGLVLNCPPEWSSQT